MKTFLAFLSVLSLPAAAQTPCEHLKLTDFDAPPFQGGNNRPDYGEAIAMSGDRLVIGIPGNGVTGKAEVYELDGPNWRRMAVLEPPPFVSNDYANAVAVSGDTVLVADRLENDVYVYELIAGVWTNTQMLVPSLTPSQYGFSVAVDGNRALVCDVFGAGFVGFVYVFERTAPGQPWLETARLLSPDGANNDKFGASMALDGDVAVIGAPGNDVLDSEAGAAYVFTRGPVAWQAPVRLDPSLANSFGGLGNSVDISGSTIAIASEGSDLAVPFGGAVFLFEDVGGSWTEVDALAASDAQAGMGFGTSVALEGNVAIVGSPDRDAGGGALGAGAGYVFQDLGSGWVETDILIPADREVSDAIGTAVVTSGDLVALNAPGDDDEGPDFGAAYTFSLSGTTCPTLESFPDRISVASGGVFTMLLRPGQAFANQDYIVVSTATGTNPGFFLDGFFFPLNQDDWFNLVLGLPNTFLFGNTVGTLDGAGRATATFTLPGGLPAGVAGLKFHWAFAVFDAQDASTLLVSTPVLVRLDV